MITSPKIDNPAADLFARGLLAQIFGGDRSLIATKAVFDAHAAGHRDVVVVREAFRGIVSDAKLDNVTPAVAGKLRGMLSKTAD